MENKYKLTEETTEWDGHTLHRIEAVKNFGGIKVGDRGGWIEKEANLSHDGNAWVYGNAKVYGHAKVYGNAEVYGNACVYDNACVFGDAWVFGNAKVCDNAWVYGHAEVYGNAKVFGNAEVFGNACVGGDVKVYDNADYIVFKNWWSSGRYFTWTRSNNRWKVGCFYGTGDELVKKAYADSDVSGREYERIVRYVESILQEENKEKSEI